MFAGSYSTKPLDVLNRHIQAEIHKVDLQIIFNHFLSIKANLVKTVEEPYTYSKSIHQYLLIFLLFYTFYGFLLINGHLSVQFTIILPH